MKITVERKGNVTVITLNGRMVKSDELNQFRERIREEVAQEHKQILVDLKDTSYVDSTGLGEIILALGTITQTICADCNGTLSRDDQGEWERCHQCNSTNRKPWGQFKLANPGRQAADLIDFAKLDTIFEIYKTRADALTSFTKNS